MRRLLTVLLLTVTACGAGSNDTTATTLPPNVVPEAASAWTSITVRAADGRQADVPRALQRRASPLLTGRLLSSPEPRSAYGLDAPVATITYRGPGRTRVVDVGKPTFDGHGYYVQRQGDPRVFLVPADQLEPLLALVS